MPELSFRVKCDTVPGDSVRVVGNEGAIGAWNPQNSKVELTTDASSYPWWSGSAVFNAGTKLEYKFVVVNGGNARWEAGIDNRSATVSASGKVLETEFDKAKVSEKGPGAASPVAPGPAAAAASPKSPYPTASFGAPGQAPPPAPAAAPAPAQKKAEPAAFLPPPRDGSDGGADGFVQKIASEDAKRKSWRNKLDLSRTVLEGGDVTSLNELACLQAYLTWVASGQIKCQEDGGHHRPCAHADASRKITSMLWQFAARGDAQRFIARRIFPSLPSYAEQFTVAVPMTRIRDIAHRGDIPHELKQEIKHTLQNKLHRCADPGDMVTCHNLIEKCRRENRYSEAFMREFETFYVELKEFFNAGGLDEKCEQSKGDASLRPAVEHFLGQKHGGASQSDQLAALADLRALVAPRVESEQFMLLLDLELEKYAFVLLSQLAGDLERTGRGSEDWWKYLLHILQLALRQSELSGVAVEECAAATGEFAACVQDVGNSSKVGFLSLRLAAAADRALRICFAVTQKLEIAYSAVPALGRALHIDGHAVSVFVEAEMRTSMLFQVSKLVQLVMSEAKRAANLPLWTAISAGSTCGKVVRCNELSESWVKTLPPEGAVVFCNEASGDEELPPLCRGVVVARDLPVLSHLALRARQLGAVFGCTAERALYDGLLASAPDGKAVKLEVKADGDVRIEAVSDSALKAAAPGANGKAPDAKAKSKNGSGPKLGKLSTSEQKVLAAVSLADAPQTAGSKAASSGKLESIAAKAGFKAPKGLAVPFGVMTKQVSGGAIDSAVAALQQALEKNTGKVAECAQAVREAVAKCKVPKAVLDDLVAGLPADTTRVAVRSSANSEDLEGVSGAGLHDSVLGVNPKDAEELERAVLQVWGSMFTLRAVQSRYAAGMPLYKGIAMGVLVQPMVSLEGRAYAFIAFSKHVIEKDAGSVYLELCVGLGETLASADQPGTPYRLVVKKEKPNAVKVLSLASFSFGLEDAAGGPKSVRVDYSKERLTTDQPFLEQLARDVAAVATKVEECYGAPMDMEGVVLERGTGREVHLVQARPIVEA